MIDLHSHILHDIDDGARNLAEAVAMARAAVADGVTIMAATPHGRSSVSLSSRYSVSVLHERLEELRAVLKAQAIPLELVTGTELYGEPGMVERLRAGELLPYGASRAVLVEFPLGITQSAAEQIVFALQLAGYRAVVAHPERYQFVYEDPNSLIPMVERGAMMQITGDAILGLQSERRRRVAEVLLTHGLAQILSTDAHGPHVGRLPNLAATRARAAELVGANLADRLTREFPGAVLRDEPLPPPAPQRLRRRPW